MTRGSSDDGGADELYVLWERAISVSESEQQIIRLLTEIRDAQREELAYRRRVLDESFDLQKKSIALQKGAVRAQRVYMWVVIGGVVLVLALVALAKLLTGS